MLAPTAGVLLALCVYAFAPCSAVTANYTPPKLNETYISSPRFVAHGLAPLYDSVTLFLRGIQHEDLLPPDLLLVSNGTIQINKEIEYGSVAKFYIGILVVSCIGLAIVLIAPCVGLIWCCCCGSSKREDEKQERSSGGTLLAPLFLTAITCLILAGVAIAFASNAYIEKGIVGIGKHIRTGTADVRLYVDNAETEVDTLLRVNYDELSTALNSVLKDATTETEDIVKGFLNSLPLDSMDQIADGIDATQKDLNNILSEINNCTSASQEIVRKIQDAKADIDQRCGTNCPPELEQFIASLTPPTFNSLPTTDINETIVDIQNVLPADFKQILTQNRIEVNNLADQVETAMKNISSSMDNAFNQSRTELQQRASELLQAVSNASDTLLNVDKQVSDYQDSYNASYSSYRISVFAVYSTVILIIAALITLGLVNGCFCSKNSYSFLNIPVILILLTMSVWMLIVVALFITGVVTDRACEFLRKPENHQVSHLVDELLQEYRQGIANSSQLPPLHNISYYFEECRNDMTMYEVIDLDSTIQIDSIVNYADNFDVNPYLEKINTTIKDVVKIKLIPQDVQQQINDLKNSPISRLSLETLQNEFDLFENTTEQLSASSAGWERDLRNLGNKFNINVTTQISNLEEIVTTAKSLQNSAKRLRGFLGSLEHDVKLGNNSFSEALQWLLVQANQTDDLIAKSAPHVSKLATDTAEDFRKEVKAYLQWVADRVKTHALKCKPIMNVYDTMIMGVCDEIVSPWNAFWAMSGMCLLLFIPAAFLASSLASYKS